MQHAYAVWLLLVCLIVTTQGSELRPNVVLVVGIYNSDYTRNLPISYQLNVGVPQGGSSSWMHPYMSVVLGVTAAIILCLLLTLTKRFLQRRGIGPWRNQRLAIQGGQGTPVISVRVGLWCQGKMLQSVMSLAHALLRAPSGRGLRWAWVVEENAHRG